METYKKPLVLSKNDIIQGKISGAFPAILSAVALVGFAKALGDDDARPEFARTLTERKNFALA